MKILEKNRKIQDNFKWKTYKSVKFLFLNFIFILHNRWSFFLSIDLIGKSWKCKKKETAGDKRRNEWMLFCATEKNWKVFFSSLTTLWKISIFISSWTKREAYLRWSMMKNINDNAKRLKKIGVDLRNEKEIINKRLDFVFKTSTFSQYVNHYFRIFFVSSEKKVNQISLNFDLSQVWANKKRRKTFPCTFFLNFVRFMFVFTLCWKTYSSFLHQFS